MLTDSVSITVAIGVSMTDDHTITGIIVDPFEGSSTFTRRFRGFSSVAGIPLYSGCWD